MWVCLTLTIHWHETKGTAEVQPMCLLETCNTLLKRSDTHTRHDTGVLSTYLSHSTGQGSTGSEAGLVLLLGAGHWT